MATTTETASVNAIELRGIAKSFGGVQALTGATLSTVNRASVCGLVGQNGAGKSTLHQDSGRSLRPPTRATSSLTGSRHRSADATEGGAPWRPFHSSGSTAPAEFYSGRGALPWSRAESARFSRSARSPARCDFRAAEVLHDYFGVDLPPGILISELTAAQKQIVQITRALLQGL